MRPSVRPGVCRAAHAQAVALVVALAVAPARAEDLVLVVDPTRRAQTLDGFGLSVAGPRTADPRWRAAVRALDVDVLRVDVAKRVLAHPSGDLRRPVWLGPDLAANVARFDFDEPSVAAMGEAVAALHAAAPRPERARVVGALWSPPHWMKGPTGTRQFHVTAPDVRRPTPWMIGRDGDSIGGRLRTDPATLVQLGRYVAAWITGFERRFGVRLHAVSLQNESTYENPFDSATLAVGPAREPRAWWQWPAAVAAVRRELDRAGLETVIAGPHVAHVRHDPGGDSRLEHQMGFIVALRNRGLVDAVGLYDSNGYGGVGEANARSWAAYWHGTSEVPGPWPWWLRFRGVKVDGKPVWVDETSGEPPRWTGGPGEPATAGALGLAVKVHDALVHAHASAWLYWLLDDPWADGATEESLLGPADLDAPDRAPKYAAFAHFTRYVPAGAVRVEARFAGGTWAHGGAGPYDGAHAIGASAFVDPATQRLVVVLVNATDRAYRTRVTAPGWLLPRRLVAVTSDARATLVAAPPQPAGAPIAVPGRAVVTVVGQAPGRIALPPAAEPGPRPAEPWPDVETSGRVRTALERVFGSTTRAALAAGAGALVVAGLGVVAVRRARRARPRRV